MDVVKQIFKELAAFLGGKLDTIEARLDELNKKEPPVIHVHAEPGHTPTDEELLKLITPLIPDVKDGYTPTEDELLLLIQPLVPKMPAVLMPTNEELLSLIRPLIPNVQNGETPSNDKLLSLIQPLIPEPEQGKSGNDGSPDTGEEIISKINEDTSDLVIRKEKVEGLSGIEDRLRTNEANTYQFMRQGGPITLGGLTDVDIVGILSGQSIRWDGKRFVPYTPSGGVNTVVYGEIVGGSGTSFTLAHTPVAGTLRLYGIGQRLTEGAPNDYTNVTTAITTANTWNTGDILADYEY